MTQILCKAAAIFLTGCILTACATGPTYPVRTGYTQPPPIQPRYPVHDRAASAPLPPATPAPMVEEAPAPQASPTPQVETQSLPPVASAPAPPPPVSLPATPAPSPPVLAALPPAERYSPPPQAYETPPEAEPPAPVRMRPGPPRYITAGKVVEAHGMFRDYEVKKHDHIDAIARELGITRKIIVDENHLKAPYAIRPGDVLKVPVAKAYVVQSGDTLTTIGKRFDVGPEGLASLNEMSVRKPLKAGQKVALPVDFKDRGPTRVRGAMVVDTRPQASVPKLARREREPQPAAPAPSSYYAHQSQGQSPYQSRTQTQTQARPEPQPLTPLASRAMTPEQAYPPAPPREAATAPVQSPSAASDVAAAARGRFIWPVRGSILSAFGIKGMGRRNDGVDIGAPMGEVVRAAAAGDVVYAGDQVPGFGNLVLVKHPDGWVTAYAHLEKVSVQMRQQIAQGAEIGQVGQTGGVDQPQLHFEIRYAPTPQEKAKPVDPMLVLPR
ncbi:MAG TPA: LysM peptidoglycan-binding domain-containing M23 family metallopeptidase [Caulobacteraceae bacterium]